MVVIKILVLLLLLCSSIHIVANIHQPYDIYDTIYTMRKLFLYKKNNTIKHENEK